MITKKLTISIDKKVYEGLYKIIGPRKIGRFLETLARPHVLKDESLSSQYGQMAQDEKREEEANEWCENLIT